MDKIIREDSSLTPDYVSHVGSQCLTTETNASMTQELLGRLLRLMKEFMSQNTCEHEWFCIILDSAQTISNRFWKEARRQNALKYYYMGMFHANIEQFRAILNEQRGDSVRAEVSNRKHFNDIMQTLEHGKIIRQSEICRQLSLDKGNLCREMERLDTAGLIESRKIGKYRFYNLTPKGESYYRCYSIKNQGIYKFLDKDVSVQGLRQKVVFQTDLYIVSYEETMNLDQCIQVQNEQKAIVASRLELMTVVNNRVNVEERALVEESKWNYRQGAIAYLRK